MTDIHFDFETASELDLTEVGVLEYAEHPSTRIICMAWSDGDGDVHLWWPGDPAPYFVENLCDFEFVAHHARFELHIWNNCAPVGWGQLTASQMRCTMAACAYRGLPLSLEEASAVLDLDEQKSKIGALLMPWLSSPRKREMGRATRRTLATKIGIEDWEALSIDEFECALLTAYGEYCCQDVRAEMALDEVVGRLPDDEQRLWVLDDEINTRGITVDRPLVRAALDACAVEAQRLNDRIAIVTGGAVKKTTEVGKLKTWAGSRLGGAPLTSLAKEDMKELLSDERLPDDVREAVELRRDAGRTSNAKLIRMWDCSASTGRARDQAQYHGATTGRWAGRLIQLQNMPRPSMEVDPEIFACAETPTELADLLIAIYGTVPGAVADVLRHFVKAEDGKVLACADFSAIEGVVVAALAGEERKLQAFRDVQAGKADDIYCVTASGIYGYACRKKTHPLERQVGKIAELASGFGGSVGAWKRFGADRLGWDDEAIKAKVEAWRDDHPMIAGIRDPETGYRKGGLWKGLEYAAKRAVEHYGQTFTYRDISFCCEGPWLVMRLPSGRRLHYFRPRLVEGDYGPQLEYEAYRQVDTRKVWTTVRSYGGLLTENAVQAAARDLLVHAMWNCRKKGLPIVLHVHDEIVVEVNEADGEDSARLLTACMEDLPSWASGWPVKAEAWTGLRYRK